MCPDATNSQRISTTAEPGSAGTSAVAPRHRRDARRRVSRKAIVEALNVVPEGVYFLDADSRVVDSNATAARDTGYRRGELRTMSLAAVLSDDPDGRLRSAIEGLLRGNAAAASLRARQRLKGGGSRPVRVQLQLVETDEESLIVAVVHGAENHRDLEESFRPAGRDHLTALPARSALERRLRRAERRARRRCSRFGVLFVDLDGFKGVNDTGGHRAGDLVLQIVGKRLQSSIRPGDFIARYGGDEFVALVENVSSRQELDEIAERIGAALSAPIDAAGSRFHLSASVGVAIGGAHQSGAEILDQADRAMYLAKRALGPHRPCRHRTGSGHFEEDPARNVGPPSIPICQPVGQRMNDSRAARKA